MRLTKDAAQFLIFMAMLFGSAFVGGILIDQRWARGFEMPVGFGWIFLVIVSTGFIISGKEGAKALLSMTVLMWSLAVIGALLIAWLAIAGAGHSL
jgi:hypothetical protein